MIFTLRSNQARIERAEKAGYAKAVTEVEERTKAAVAEVEERTKAAVAEAEERGKAGLAARQQAWESWNERRLIAARDSRPFAEPPPGTASGMNGNGGIRGNGSGSA